MKITLERLREIITEEVIKEELAPEIAAPAIAAMLQGMQAETTSDVFGAAFDELYGEGALEDEAERQAGMEEPEEEEFPTDYQAGGAEGDRPTMGFKENLAEIIEEEISKALYGINEGCGDDPAQQLADQLGIDVGVLEDAIEQMGLNVVSAQDLATSPEEEYDARWANRASEYEEEMPPLEEDKEKYEKCAKSIKKEKGIMK